MIQKHFQNERVVCQSENRAVVTVFLHPTTGSCQITTASSVITTKSGGFFLANSVRLNTFAVSQQKTKHYVKCQYDR